ncbi:MAG: DUF5666 domain-containing protein [Aquabacterium sp.]
MSLPTPSRPTRPARRTAALAGAALATLLAAACGGGGGETPVPPSGGERALAYSEGAIDGFGSVIVNGVRFDDDAASVEGEDGRLGSRNDLRLGMTVELEGDNLNRTSATGRALRIRHSAQIVGPVQSVDVANSRLVVLGQPVNVGERTVFGESIGSLGAIQVGDVVAVYGQMQGSDSYRATRIHGATSVADYRLRGMLDSLDTAAMTFTVNGATVSYAPLASGGAPSGDDFRRCVQLRLETAAVANVWQATGMRPCPRKMDDGAVAQLRGMVTAFTSPAAFEVNGISVDASNAAFPDGTAELRLGAAVEVEGTVRSGTVVASKVGMEDRRVGDRLFELHGLVETPDANQRRFMLRGVTVRWGDATQFKDGTAARLLAGARVEVKGRLSSDRSQLDAARIEFK